MPFYLFSMVLIASSLMAVLSRRTVHAVLALILAFFNAAALFILLGAELLAMTLIIVYVGAVAVLFLFVVMLLDVRLLPNENDILINHLVPRTRSYPITLAFLTLVKSFTIFMFCSLSGTFLLYLIYKRWPMIFSSSWRNHGLALVIVLSGYLLSKAMCGVSFIRAITSFIKILKLKVFLSIFLFVELVSSVLCFYIEGISRASNKDLAHAIPYSGISNPRSIGHILYTDYVYLFQVSGLILLIAMIGAILLAHSKRTNVKRQDSFHQAMRSKESTLELVKVKTGSGSKW